jgi:arsenite-transporting ATPase
MGDGPRYHFFSGKGGVGKTTLAAATAVHLARTGRRVLITSTDPAHSLSDVFDRQIGHQGAEIMPGLRALEIDSTARWAEATSLPEDRKPGRIEKALGDAMRMLGEAPGVDEFISLDLLVETMHTDQFDEVVFDTAPTGHTLRLLLLPNMLDGWIGRMIALRGFFSRFGRAIRKLIPRGERKDMPDMSENLKSARERMAQVRDLIKDSGRTRFVLVTIPEAMSVFETQRTMQQLQDNNIPVGVVIANMIQPDSDNCDHCKLRHRIHTRELENIEELVGPIPLVKVASKSTVVRGPQALETLGNDLWRP